MRALAYAALALTISVSSAATEEARQWMGASQEDGASLLYGLPQSDDAPVSFRCEMPGHEFVMTLSLPPDFEPRDGPVKLAMAAPPTTDQLFLEGHVHYLEEMGVTFLETRPPFDAAIARMLKQGTELIFTIGETKLSYPLAGAADAMRFVEAACAKPG